MPAVKLIERLYLEQNCSFLDRHNRSDVAKVFYWLAGSTFTLPPIE